MDIEASLSRRELKSRVLNVMLNQEFLLLTNEIGPGFFLVKMSGDSVELVDLKEIDSVLTDSKQVN
jgi:hypothetical protein